jgi:Flp pilus assembly protein TadG
MMSASILKSASTLLREEESGQALVEFAVISTLLILLLIGIANYMIYIYQEMEVTAAAGAAATYATIPANAPMNSTNISAAEAAGKAAAPDVSNVAVTVTTVYSCAWDGSSVAKTSTCSDGYSPMLFVQVSSTGTAYALLAWSPLANSLSLSSSALMEIPYQ